jgi:hypothetical protein
MRDSGCLSGAGEFADALEKISLEPAKRKSPLAAVANAIPPLV